MQGCDLSMLTNRIVVILLIFANVLSFLGKGRGGCGQPFLSTFSDTLYFKGVVCFGNEF